MFPGKEIGLFFNLKQVSLIFDENWLSYKSQ